MITLDTRPESKLHKETSEHDQHCEYPVLKTNLTWLNWTDVDTVGVSSRVRRRECSREGRERNIRNTTTGDICVSVLWNVHCPSPKVVGGQRWTPKGPTSGPSGSFPSSYRDKGHTSSSLLALGHPSEELSRKTPNKFQTTVYNDQ